MPAQIETQTDDAGRSRLPTQPQLTFAQATSNSRGTNATVRATPSRTTSSVHGTPIRSSVISR